MPENLLVIRLSALGDLVLALPSLHHLRRRHPEAHLAIVVRDRYRTLFAEDPVIDEVISVARGEEPEVAGSLRARGWDLVLDLQGTLRSRRLAAGIRARERRCVKRDRLARWGLLLRARLGASGPGRPVPHVVRRFLEAAGAGGDEFAPPLRLSLFETTRERSGDWLRARGMMPGRLLAILPGASHPVKAWTPEGFAEVARTAETHWGLQPLVLGGEEDRDVVGRVARLLGRPSEIWCANGDLPFLAALLERCRAAVANDSGVSHLAAAVGTPVVGVFGPTVAEFGFHPWGDNTRIHSKSMTCRPCSLHGSRSCRIGTHRCMREISPADVVSSVSQALEVSSRRPLLRDIMGMR